MPVTLVIKGKKKRFPTPMQAIAHVLGGLSGPDSGVDALALSHAVCVASAQAVRTNTRAGRGALKTLHQMTEAFRGGDMEKGIRLAVVLGLDSLLTNSRAAGVRHPDTCVAFEKAYLSWADEDQPVTAAAAEPEPEPEIEEPLPEVSGEVIDDDALAGLDMLFDDDDDNEDDWAD